MPFTECHCFLGPFVPLTRLYKNSRIHFMLHNAFIYIVNGSDSRCSYLQWRHGKKLLQDTTLVSKLCELDIDAVSEKAAQRAKDILSNSSVELCKNSSAAAASLYLWVCGSHRLIIIILVEIFTHIILTGMSLHKII